MPPFRYLGNILRLQECAFRPRRGKSKIALAPMKAGWLMQMGACFARLGFDWPVPTWPTVPFRALIDHEMFVWHAA